MTAQMTDNRKGGIALIAGSIAGMFAMAVHPSVDNTHWKFASGPAHTIALAAVLVLFLGATGLSAFLHSRDRLAICALATFGFASVAIMIAAAVSGYIFPDVSVMMSKDVAQNGPQWVLMMKMLFRFNQAFARIYSVATAIAIILWSIRCLERPSLSRPLAIYGCITSPLVVLLIFTGHIRLDVHGMTAVLLTEVIWFVGMGVKLLYAPDRQGPTSV